MSKSRPAAAPIPVPTRVLPSPSKGGASASASATPRSHAAGGGVSSRSQPVGSPSSSRIRSGASTPTAISPPTSVRKSKGQATPRKTNNTTTTTANANANGGAELPTLSEDAALVANMSIDILKATADRLNQQNEAARATQQNTTESIDIKSAIPSSVDPPARPPSARSSLTGSLDKSRVNSQSVLLGHDPDKNGAYTKHLHDVIRELQHKNAELTAENQDLHDALRKHSDGTKNKDQNHKKNIRLYQCLFATLLTNQYVKSWKTKRSLFRLQELMFGLIQPIIREYKLNPSRSTTFDSNTTNTIRKTKINTSENAHAPTSTDDTKARSKTKKSVAHVTAAHPPLTDKQRIAAEHERQLLTMYAETAAGGTPHAAKHHPPSGASTHAAAPSQSGASSVASPSSTAADSTTPAASLTDQSSPEPAPSPSHARRQRHVLPAGEDLSAPHLQLDVTIDDVQRIARFKKVKMGSRLMATPIVDLTNYLEDVFTICQQALINLLSRLPQARLETESLAQRNVELADRLLDVESKKGIELEAAMEWKTKFDQLTLEHARLQHSYEVVKADYEHAIKHMQPTKKYRETRIESMASVFVSKAESVNTNRHAHAHAHGRVSRSPSPSTTHVATPHSHSQSQSQSRPQSAMQPQPHTGRSRREGGAGSAARAVEHLRSLQSQQERPSSPSKQTHTHTHTHHVAAASSPPPPVASPPVAFVDDGAETDFLFDLPVRSVAPAILHASLNDFKEEYSVDEEDVYAPIVALKQEQDLARNFQQLLLERDEQSEHKLREIKEGRTITRSQNRTTIDERAQNAGRTQRNTATQRETSRSPSRRIASSHRPQRKSASNDLDDPSDVVALTRGVSSLSRPRPHSAAYPSEMMKAAAVVAAEERRHASHASHLPHTRSAGDFSLNDRAGAGAVAAHTVKASLRELSPGRPTHSFTSHKKFDTRDIGGTNLYLGATSASFDRHTADPATRKKMEREQAGGAAGASEGRTVAALNGTKRDKENPAHSVSVDSRTGAAPVRSVRPASSPLRRPKRETYFEHVLASPLNTPQSTSATHTLNLTHKEAQAVIDREGARRHANRPQSSTGIRTTRKDAANNRETLTARLHSTAAPNNSPSSNTVSTTSPSSTPTLTSAHSRHPSLHAPASPTGGFSAAAAVAAALAGVDGVDTEELPNEDEENDIKTFLPPLPSLEEQNAMTRSNIQYIYDPADDAADDGDGDDDLSSLNPGVLSSTVRFPTHSSRNSIEYEDSIIIAQGNGDNHRRSESPTLNTNNQFKSRPTSAYATIGGKITRIATTLKPNTNSILAQPPPAFFNAPHEPLSTRTALDEERDTARASSTEPPSASEADRAPPAAPAESHVAESSTHVSSTHPTHGVSLVPRGASSVADSDLIISSVAPFEPLIAGSTIRHITSQNAIIEVEQTTKKKRTNNNKKSVTKEATSEPHAAATPVPTDSTASVTSATPSGNSSARTTQSTREQGGDSARSHAAVEEAQLAPASMQSIVADVALGVSSVGPASPRSSAPVDVASPRDLATILAQPSDFDSYIREIESERRRSVFSQHESQLDRATFTPNIEATPITSPRHTGRESEADREKESVQPTPSRTPINSERREAITTATHTPPQHTHADTYTALEADKPQPLSRPTSMNQPPSALAPSPSPAPHPLSAPAPVPPSAPAPVSAAGVVTVSPAMSASVPAHRLSPLSNGTPTETRHASSGSDSDTHQSADETHAESLNTTPQHDTITSEEPPHRQQQEDASVTNELRPPSPSAPSTDLNPPAPQSPFVAAHASGDLHLPTPASEPDFVPAAEPAIPTSLAESHVASASDAAVNTPTTAHAPAVDSHSEPPLATAIRATDVLAPPTDATPQRVSPEPTHASGSTTPQTHVQSPPISPKAESATESSTSELPSCASSSPPAPSVGFTFSVPSAAPAFAFAVVSSPPLPVPVGSRSPSSTSSDNPYGDDFQDAESDHTLDPLPLALAPTSLNVVAEEGEIDHEDAEREKMPNAAGAHAQAPATVTATDQPRAMSASERFKRRVKQQA